jgi:actin-like protein 6A
VTNDEGDKMDEGGIQSSKNNYHFDLANYRDDMSIGNPIKDGLVTDWDMLERVWEHAMTNYLKVDIKDTPLLIAEKPYNPVSNRYK